MAPPSSAADSPAHPRRRNSITTSTIVIPTALKPVWPAQPPQPPPLAFELISLKPGAAAYTSLRDIISSPPVNSPTAATTAIYACASPVVVAGSGSHSISIRNRLVKQAAWAYLQPMSASPSADGPPLLRRLWLGLSAARNAVLYCVGDLRRRVAGAMDRVLRALRLSTHR